MCNEKRFDCRLRISLSLESNQNRFHPLSFQIKAMIPTNKKSITIVSTEYSYQLNSEHLRSTQLSFPPTLQLHIFLVNTINVNRTQLGTVYSSRIPSNRTPNGNLLNHLNRVLIDRHIRNFHAVCLSDSPFPLLSITIVRKCGISAVMQKRFKFTSKN